MYYIGLDVHKKIISYCIKDAGGQILREGNVGATRSELDAWMKTLPQPVGGGDGGHHLHMAETGIRDRAARCGTGTCWFVRWCR